MRLRRLEVEHFAGISKVNVTFGPGLNLLYGPNELGKSSLLEAIRAALLLPHSSSAHRDFIDWNTDESPHVRLEFETESQRIWRIDKSFGTSGSSMLEFSKDGTNYSLDARGREVDGRLRELLEWGLSPPGGGAGRTRGYPSSFLTTALLGAQGRVDEILEKGLEDDPDDSGRQLLTAALQALAEEPLFREVLDSTQERVSEAYTSTGRKSSKKGSPWQRLKERRLAAEKRRGDVRTRVESSEAAKVQIAEQQGVLEASRQQMAQTEGILEQIEMAWKRSAESREATERAAKARIEVARVQALLDVVTQTTNRLSEARAEQEALNAVATAAEERLGVATSKLEEAKETLRDLQSDDAEKNRKLREQELDKTRLSLEGQRQQTQARLEQAERIRDLERRASDLEEEIETREVESTKWQRELALLDEEVKALGERKAKAECSHLAQTWLDAEAAVMKAKARCGEVEVLRAKAAKLRSEVLELEKSVDSQKLPSAEELREMRKLETDVRVAEEKLAVGLSVVIEPKRPLKVTVTADGDERQIALSEVESFTAESEVSLDLPDLVLHVRGGSESTRAEAERLRERFQSQSAPLFERTGTASLDQVQSRLGKAEETLDRCRSLTSAFEALDAEAQGAGDVEAALLERTERLEAAEARVQAALPEGGSLDEARGWVSSESAIDPVGIEAELGKKTELVSEIKSQLDRGAGLQVSKREELVVSRTEIEAAAKGLEYGWSAVLEDARTEIAAIVEQLAENESSLKELRRGATAQTGEAEKALSKAEEDFRKSKGGLEQANLEMGEGSQIIARVEGELDSQRTAVAKENFDEFRAALELREDELAALPRPSQDISDEQRAEARALVGQARAKLRAEQDEMQRLEGALGQVGGQYAEEQLEQAEEAVRAVEESEREKDLDYGAWQLLLDTLKEAESDAVVHLGKVLVEPVEARMSELTGGRFGAPTIGPKLGTDGIMLAGANRPLDSLSVGAREQLATLFRLTIAEKLGTAVVLDDQLVQSDPERMSFFGRLMRECGREFQILVLTCQPEHYGFRPEDGVVMTDLERLIVRSGQAEGAGAS
jgi:DNA repair exonuclease SbcCD ATPase subunit